jgi:type IV secretory pathway TrbD component
VPPQPDGHIVLLDGGEREMVVTTGTAAAAVVIQLGVVAARVAGYSCDKRTRA